MTTPALLGGIHPVSCHSEAMYAVLGHRTVEYVAQLAALAVLLNGRPTLWLSLRGPNTFTCRHGGVEGTEPRVHVTTAAHCRHAVASCLYRVPSGPARAQQHNMPNHTLEHVHCRVVQHGGVLALV